MSGSDELKRLEQLTSLLFQAHPWHGVAPGPKAPEEIVAYIEIVPTDAVKYELHKPSGMLGIDRPQKYSSFCPTLYGFIPQTFCAEESAKRASKRNNLQNIRGDGDPLDICVLTEKAFSHANFLLRARPIGGLTMFDGKEVDDKVIAVLADDVVYGKMKDISEVPEGLIERLRHYFLTYTQPPEESEQQVEIPEVYGRDQALEVIRVGQRDYRNHYGAPEERMAELKKLLTSR
jgi:inorganic pyrophosphatase